MAAAIASARFCSGMARKAFRISPCSNAVVASLHSGGPASLVWIAARTFCALPRALSTLRVAFSNSLKDVSRARFCRIAGVCISSPSGGRCRRFAILGRSIAFDVWSMWLHPPVNPPTVFGRGDRSGGPFRSAELYIYDACAAYRFSIGHTTGLFRGVICQHPGGHRADLIPVATTISFGPIGRAASAIARTIILEVRSRRGARLAQCALLFSGSCRGARPRLTMKTIRQSSIGSSLGGNRSLAWGFRRRRWDESKWTRQRDREHSRTAVRRLFQACRPERRCALDTGCCFSVLSFWPKAFGSTRAVCSPRRFSPVRAASTQVVC
jgi:hypothetical protein